MISGKGTRAAIATRHGGKKAKDDASHGDDEKIAK